MSHAALTSLVPRLQAGETIPASELELLGEDQFASRVVGLRWDTLALDRVTAHLDVDERHHQPYGIVHGGVWCTLVETIGSIGAALHAAGRGEVAVGVTNSTDFLRPHRSGRVEIEGVPIHVGRSQQLWQVVVTREDGKPVARGQLRVQSLPADRMGGA
ncbi:PaaI family thioesterase [Egicoccus sp. AB-alg6-2]|uniref:PaaI family thioesterase n=1 Tax=Egicoccus sp. AB-alg6-2 TaxID=3242692 RepID=UPI00359CE200